LSSSDVAEARRQMEDAAFRRDRLQAAVARLRERLDELKAQEEDQRRQLVYDRVKAERDKLAAELADLYPGIEQKLRELLPRIAANDREIEYINNHKLPSDAERLLVAELVARGLRGFVENGVETPRITQVLRLPAFERSQFAFAWPRSR
jgi:chromosome segregation ATPase